MKLFGFGDWSMYRKIGSVGHLAVALLSLVGIFYLLPFMEKNAMTENMHGLQSLVKKHAVQGKRIFLDQRSPSGISTARFP